MKKSTTLLLTLLSVFAFAQNGLDFDGTNDYAYAAQGGPTGTSNRTVECWIKTSSSISTQQVILDWGAMSPNGARFTLNMLNFGKLRIEVGGNGFNSTQSIADGNWHHIAITYDNAAALKFKMYIDGQLEQNQNTTVAVNTSSTGGFQIGRRNDMTNYFDGIIDEVRVWSTVRTATELLASMNGEFCTPPSGLVAYYKFNQGVASGSNTGVTTLTNALGSNNATLSGFALAGSSSNWVTGKVLTSGSASSSNISLTVCDSYTASNGSLFTTSGNYIDTIQSAAGCDSILNIALTVNSSSNGSLTATACNKYLSPSGSHIWTTSGNYTDVIPNAVGCDSTLTINLTVNTIDTNVLVNGAFLTSYVTGATYQWLDCNNNFAPISGATSQVFKATANGNYAVQVTKNNCTDTSTCYTIANIGIGEADLKSSMVIYPNPAHDEVSINLGAKAKTLEVSIVDVIGKQMQRAQFSNTDNVQLRFDLRPGIYFLRISADGKAIVKKLTVR